MAGNGSVFHASAPVRLDFAGGWTDVAPFAARERGAVVNAAIDLRAVARVEPGGEGYRLTSDDLGETLALKSLDRVATNGRLALLHAAVHRSGLPAGSVQTRCQVPPGSGLGSSGALDVALLAALDAARGTRRTAIELAEAGWELETVDAGLPGGKQDQYAAALGGFHHFQFEHGRVEATALALAPGLEPELEQRILVCYTGNSRVSSDTIARVMSRYEAGDPEVVDALRTMAGLADRMADALREGRLATIGELLSRNWTAQQRLDPGMRTESMARLEAAMRDSRSLGGKAAGAGAGGSMFFLIDGNRETAARAAREAGATVLPFKWAAEGVHVW